MQPSLGAVSRYVRDYSGPTLVKFALDLSANRVYLVFSEPIDISPGIERLNSAFDRFIVGHDIFAVLQNNATRAADECLTGPGNNCYELNDTAVSSLHHADDPCGNVEPLTSVRQQTVLLQFTDLSYITSLGFGREIGDTYLCLEGMNEVVVRGPFRDYFNNGNNERSCISAVQACTIIPDSRAPSLLGFRLFEDNADYQRTSSVHATTIVLTFSEPVAYDSFDLSDFNFYSDTSATGPNLTLSGGIVETQVGLSGSREVTVLLNNPDTAFLKLNDFIATSVENTYLMIGAGALNDTSGNPINTSPIIQASEVLSDDTAPRLVNFTIDLNTAQLNLTFDDVIDISTFDIRGVTLQDAPTATVAYTLRTAQNITTYDSYTVVIRMNSLELIDLKTLPGVGSNVNNTYITLTAITIDDHRGTDVIAITDTKALQALDVVEDTTPPELLSFDLDLDSSMLFLTFSDSINLNTFNSSGLTLQNQESVTEVTDYYNLTGGSVRRSPLDASVLEVSITEEDLNEIKKNTLLATSEFTTYLSAVTETAEDAASNPLVSIPKSAGIMVNSLTNDTTGPLLRMFTLNLDNGVLMLSFSETIRLSSYNPDGITILNMANISFATANHTLTGGIVMGANGPEVFIQLSPFDLNTLKSYSTRAVPM